MTETLPTTTAATEDPAARPTVPHRTVRVVIDAADDPDLNRRLGTLEAPTRIVVRPTPVRSATDLVWDVLARRGQEPRRDPLPAPERRRRMEGRRRLAVRRRRH
ncbi:hypothetical protein [Streptomyces sp. NPDC017086]|uniref:hypothetical protein n=1 Tax=Streptomyces sp. NPDC017086 TaxID=3364976 RepID=UPI00379E71E9